MLDRPVAHPGAAPAWPAARTPALGPALLRCGVRRPPRPAGTHSCLLPLLQWLHDAAWRPGRRPPAAAVAAPLRDWPAPDKDRSSAMRCQSCRRCTAQIQTSGRPVQQRAGPDSSTQCAASARHLLEAVLCSQPLPLRLKCPLTGGNNSRRSSQHIRHICSCCHRGRRRRLGSSYQRRL